MADTVVHVTQAELMSLRRGTPWGRRKRVASVHRRADYAATHEAPPASIQLGLPWSGILEPCCCCGRPVDPVFHVCVAATPDHTSHRTKVVSVYGYELDSLRGGSPRSRRRQIAEIMSREAQYSQPFHG